MSDAADHGGLEFARGRGRGSKALSNDSVQNGPSTTASHFPGRYGLLAMGATGVATVEIDTSALPSLPIHSSLPCEPNVAKPRGRDPIGQENLQSRASGCVRPGT